ncbi:GtrA domain-containing protein [Gammaproteobacteria bacterium]
MRIALFYSIFALIATAANIGSQDIATRCYTGSYAVTLSVVFGTVVGLLMKYVLDKKYIFKFQTKSVAHDTQVFALYTLMGILTTTIFWSFEFGFDLWFASKTARYLGGVVGLSIGYWMKYHLDKRFVFHKQKGKLSVD